MPHSLGNGSSCGRGCRCGWEREIVSLCFGVNWRLIIPYVFYGISSCLTLWNVLRRGSFCQWPSYRPEIIIFNILYQLFELRCPNTVRAILVFLALPYRRHVSAGGLQILPNFVHKRSGEFWQRAISVELYVYRNNYSMRFHLMGLLIVLYWCSEKTKIY